MAERFEQDMRALEQGAEQSGNVSCETSQGAIYDLPKEAATVFPQYAVQAQDRIVINMPEQTEAAFLAFTAFTDPYGVRWNATIRQGAQPQSVIDFMDVCAKSAQGMIALGWEPVDPKSAIVWPPADKQTEEKARIERAAQALSVEIAQKQIVPQAKSALFNSAIALGIVKDAKDEAGLERLMQIGEALGFDVEHSLPEKLGAWIAALAKAAVKDRENAAPPPPPASTRAATPSTTPPPSRAAPPPPPASAASAPPQPHGPYSGNAAPLAGEQTMRIAKLKVGTTQDGSPKLEFYGRGHRYKDLDWAMGAQAFLDHFPAVAAAGWTVAHLEAIGQEYPFEATMGYTLSEKTNVKGNPYKDIASITM